ncbi:MAG TPA: hypothetical protein VMU87_08905 [Stellaceae bacterium]|nr:hypothetical protein [Stellaceae bacterium]
MDCDKALLVQAEFDGELDAAEAARLAAHREGCVPCRRRWRELAAARAALRGGATRHAASPALRRAVEARLAAAAADRPRRRPIRWWREALSFAAGAALVAVTLVAMPSGRQNLVAAVVDDHIRALQPGHLRDVVSTDQHTVKPWFDGRLDFAPPVKELAQAGFPLEGGRLDYLAGRTVAALVYTHGKHTIDLFVWPDRGATTAPASTARNGYNVIHWREHGMALWAVSDLERDQLREFVRLWRQMP